MSLTPEQLTEHNCGIGGSDAFTIAVPGRDTTKSLLDVWREKTGNAPKRERREDPRMSWGERLEPAVRGWASQQLGREIVKPTETFRHPAYQFLIGHLDGEVVACDERELPREGLEVKCTDKFHADDYGEAIDAVPIRHVFQCHHYMLVTGIRRFYLAALIGGNDPRLYTIDYDPVLGAKLLERELAFWELVKSRTPPTPTTLADVDYRWPTSTETIIRANDSTMVAVAQYARLRSAERKAAREADELEVGIKAYMGGNAILTDARGKRLLTWRTQARDHVDLSMLTRDHPDLVAQYRITTNFRVFRVR